MRHLLVGDVLLEHLELLPELGVLLLAHELDQLPLRLQLLLDRAQVTDLLLGAVLQLLQVLARVLLGLEPANKNRQHQHYVLVVSACINRYLIALMYFPRIHCT